MTAAVHDLTEFGPRIERIDPREAKAAGFELPRNLVSAEELKAKEDARALQALQEESRKGWHTFTYDGETWAVPQADDWSLDIIDAFEAGQLSSFTRQVLGDDQWKRFRSKPRTLKDLRLIFEEAQKRLAT